MKLIPHVTEKTLPLAAKQVYTFKAAGVYHAPEIRAVLISRFGLHPSQVTIARRAAKKRMNRAGKAIIKRPVTTIAYVTLPQGESVAAFAPTPTPKGKKPVATKE